jgi:hypothetical protein
VALQSFRISVHAGNTPPVITSTPVLRAAEGLPYAYQVRAKDAEGDLLTYSLTQAPQDMAIGPATGLVTWTPADLALHFDGVDDFLMSPNLGDHFTDTTVTVELWFKPEAAGVIVAEEGGPFVNYSGYHDSQLEVSSTGDVLARVWGVSPILLGKVGFGTWHHAAFRYNEATQILDGFLDGVPSSSTATGDRLWPWDWGFPLHYAFGATDGTNLGSGAWFTGMIDEVRVWNVARSQADTSPELHRDGDFAGREPTAGDHVHAAVGSDGRHAIPVRPGRHRPRRRPGAVEPGQGADGHVA